MKLGKNYVVVLDLDDTLYFERDFLISGYREILKKFKLPGSWLDWMVERYDRKVEVLRALLSKAKDSGIDQLPTVIELLEVYRNHFPTIELREGTREFIDHAKALGCPLALITDGRSVTQRNKLKALGVLEDFNHLFISDEVGVSKPDKRSFEKVMDLYKNFDYVYVGDNLSKDFLAPKALGWKTICIRDSGYNIHSQEGSFEASLLPDEFANEFGEFEFEEA